MKIHGHQWEFMEIHGKSMEIHGSHGNPWESSLDICLLLYFGAHMYGRPLALGVWGPKGELLNF